MCFCAQAASVHETLFREAQTAYADGNFEKALEGFEGLEEAGFVSGEIDFNIGNCYFKLQKWGKALLFYERASRLLKRDSEIKTNLKITRSKIKDQVSTPAKPFFLKPFDALTHFLNSWELALLNVMIAWLLILALSIGLFFPQKFKRIKGFICLLLLIQIFSFVPWLMIHEEEKNSKAIILSEEVEVLSGPGPSFPVSFKIHEGSKVDIQEEGGVWSQISLPNGLSGWVQSGGYERI